MSVQSPIPNDFLEKLTEIIREYLSDEMFGVSELAREIGMSRSNLLRRVRKTTDMSASRYIRKVRLQEAMNMLRKSSLTVSEVSFKVGFGSTSYFIKCFREEYGYPPGEVSKKTDRDLHLQKEQLKTHQLVAIMFTDIEGYTALMQKDEEKALTFRNRHREVFNSVTGKYKGKILQYYGDGTLSTFGSAIDAVKCGIELQLAFGEAPKIPVRIGVHTGDILFSKDGIAGDGVNIASRIESLAAARSIFISEKVYDEVKNQPGIQTASMGIFELKNVEKPMEVFAITNPGLVVPEKRQFSGKTESITKKGIEGRKIIGIRPEFFWGLIVIAAILIGYFISNLGLLESTSNEMRGSGQSAKKSIAVLPFINDSNDSTNVYFINGLMESTLNNLQRIKDLRVLSRTSVEKYRNNPKTIPEIARELNVQYLIEGSGQKIEDQIMLNIQLIDAQSDKHLWSEQYTREAGDIFNLQMEVAKNITDQIEVIITPEEKKRINRPPTEDFVAYDFFLKGYDLIRDPTFENLQKAISFFEKAIRQDREFARAYAAIAIAYYLLDEGQEEKKYAKQINYYADQALLFDSRLAQSLTAKALFYMHNQEFEMAVSYFEKALEYNPNSDLVYLFLVDLYVHHLPNTAKYLEYALRGIEIDLAAYDSTTVSFSYLHISNAFIQSGFVDEAEQYINKSLVYFPDNLYSEYVKAFILYAKNRDLHETLDLLKSVLAKDTTRLDILQEVGKIYYYLRDYEAAYGYYEKFTELRAALGLDIYHSENAKIGYVLAKTGKTGASEIIFEKYRATAENDKSIYRNLSLAAYYSYKGDPRNAIEHLKLFSKEDNYHYWIILFLEIDPLMDNIRERPEFRSIMKNLESKFWDYHNQVREVLRNRGLI
ncbi:MAG: helix-turn-helix domain-containing protein [Cytophagales bacterium]|nr:helix-turn-helix domain-containing protein [Cytophagales bacterium]